MKAACFSLAARAPAPGPRPGARSSAGFTLIEIALVLLIFSVILALVFPRLRDPARVELTSHARRLALTFRFLRDEAILSGQIHRLNYDLNRGRYWITVESESGNLEKGRSRGGPLSRPVSFPNTVAFSDIVFQATGKRNQGTAFPGFYPDGIVDPTNVHTDNGREP